MIPTPMKSIRAKCLDCSGGSPKEVRECPIKNCSLFPYRFGRRPRAGDDDIQVTEFKRKGEEE